MYAQGFSDVLFFWAFMGSGLIIISIAIVADLVQEE